MPTLTTALRTEYQALFDTCQIRADRQPEVHKTVARIVGARQRYADVAAQVGVPWHVVGIIHCMEGSLNFNTHLHNGDPLSQRTVQVPAGRPKKGSPPFSWEDSAVDALTFEKYDAWDDWSLPGTLYKWETYNGWGYRRDHPDVKSPYLWSFTNQYTRGKYIADGTWSPTTVSKQAGAAALLRRLAEIGGLDTDFDTDQPELAQALTGSAKGALRYAPKVVTPGGAELQRYLNTFPGIFLREDGKLGPRTSDAYKQVFGQYLKGDPRA
ncbi:MAG: hypothetical protein JWQ07_1501 [Ramlibacter sp.]|nr:hypothetical protein [Ramlibacter sp.]